MAQIPGKEDEHKGFQRVFPLISAMFGLNVSIMVTCLIDIGCLRRNRDYMCAPSNVFEALRELESTRSTFEKSVVKIEGCRNVTLLKSRSMDESPIEIW